MSILGDSISTYTGISNDSENTNSTIQDNLVWYTGSTSDVTSADQTWWMQLANNTGMNLLVNNSSGGARVVSDRPESGKETVTAAYKTRCVQLHDDTGNNAGTNPDVIAIMIGTNDYYIENASGSVTDIDWDSLITDNGDGTFNYATPTTFAECYAIMLHKMSVEYENADIFACSLTMRSLSGSQITKFASFNQVIIDLCNSDMFKNRVVLVDLYNNCGITLSNINTYTADGVHLKQTGMDKVTDCIIEAMVEYYLNK